MTEQELRAAESGRRIGIQDVELMMLREFDLARNKRDTPRMAELSTALRIVRELFPELTPGAGQASGR